jgi:GDPmannose 4,6-dehydratase
VPCLSFIRKSTASTTNGSKVGLSDGILRCVGAVIANLEVSMKRALITGITGQDGSYLAELLLSEGYEVHGLIRRASTFNTRRLEHVYQDTHAPGVKMFLHYGDLSTGEQLTSLIYDLKPDEVYHLGGQSHVMVSFEIPEYTADVTGVGTVRLLEAIRRSGIKTRFYQASSSEMFGAAKPPQSERTAFYPRSPYGAAKVYSYWMAVNYREAYGLFICNGILFNHESPRRGETFVTRKITRAVASTMVGQQQKLYLGNLHARRDWGYAPEYVHGMWQILQQEQPGDYVLGTGESHTVEEFVTEAFEYVGLDWRKHVELDARYMRPTEVEFLQADSAKARKAFGWEPKIGFKDLVHIMVDADLDGLSFVPIGNGRRILQSQFGDWHQWDKSVSHTLRAASGALY